MLEPAVARSDLDLLALRVVTGVGPAGTVAGVAVLVREYVSDRWRATTLST